MDKFKTILDIEKQKYKQDNNNKKPKETKGLELFNPFNINPLNLKNFHGKGYEKL